MPHQIMTSDLLAPEIAVGVEEIEQEWLNLNEGVKAVFRALAVGQRIRTSSDHKAYQNGRRGLLAVDPTVETRAFEAYRTVRVESDDEWNNERILQQYIPDHTQYRWIRVYYLWEGITNVPRFFRSLRSASLGRGFVPAQPKVAQAIENIRRATEQAMAQQIAIPIGGFVPRERRPGGRACPGLISEHAFGRAVDVDATHNGVFTSHEWQVIEEVIGRTVDRSIKRWWRDHGGLWVDVEMLNRNFMDWGREHLRKATQGTQLSSEPERWAWNNPHFLGLLQQVLSRQGKQGNEAAHEIVSWTDRVRKRAALGFMNLPKHLIEQFRENRFIWGLTFLHPDIHHFEGVGNLVTGDSVG